MMWNKFFNLFTILTLLSLLITPVGGASAQESGPARKKMPLQSTGNIPAAPKESIAPNASSSTPAIANLISGNLLQDPSFEASYGSSAFWGQSSTNFNTPLCAVSVCGSGGTAGPRTGNVWAWFGGADFANDPNLISPEVSQVWQYVTFPSCGAILQFYFWIGAADPGSDANDVFLVGLDGLAVFSIDATQASTYSSYTLVSLDVSAYADGNVHLLQLFSRISDQYVNMNLDDVSLIGGCPTISGNVGVAGASLTYTGGSTPADGSGNYAFDVPFGWSGTVTPSLPCSSFSPSSKSYSNVTSDRTAQNYSASFNSSSGCAQLTVKFGGTTYGPYVVPGNTGDRKSFPVNDGPVLVKGTANNTVPFIASERVVFLVGSNATSFSELMGLPQNLVSNKYSFPAYDNVGFNSQLRFGNVSNSTVTVRIFIFGQEKTTGCVPDQPLSYPYSLSPGASLRVSCPGVNNGPVVVQSTGGNIVAAMRVIPNVYNGSFSEIMGLPEGQVGTSYVFPWYNNTPPLDTQLRIGNVSGSTTGIRLYIGGVEKTSGCTTVPNKPSYPYTMLRDTSVRISCPGVNKGPVRVVSIGGNIVASERVAYFSGNTGINFSELMGFPEAQLTTSYLFPWYNNASLDTQLRFGNVSGLSATVHVFIGGQEMNSGCLADGQPSNSPYTLPVGASLRVSCPGVNNGPVKIVSNRNIVTSERVVINNGSAGINFSELMGLPQSQLTTAYVLPWYNNVSLNTQLRFGVP